MMLFGSEVIDIINIKKAKITPSYLLNLKQKLIVRNEESLNVASDVPQFALGNLSTKRSSKMNYILI